MNAPTTRTILYTHKMVCDALKVSRVELWRRVKAGTFPKPLMDGHRPKWRESTIARYIDKLERQAG